MNTTEQKELEQKSVVAAGAVVSALVWAIIRGFLIALAVIILIIAAATWQSYHMNTRHWTHHEDATGKWIPDKFD